MPSRRHNSSKPAQLSIVLKPKERLAHKRRRARLMLGAAVLAAVVPIIAGASWLSYREDFAVRSLEVRGASSAISREVSLVSEEGIYRATSGFFSRANALLFSANALESFLRVRFPRIENVTVSRESLLSQAVIITVSEREPRHTWCANESLCYVMDAEGYVFAEGKSDRGYVFYDGLASGEPVGRNFLRGMLPGIVQLLDTLTEDGIPVRSARIVNEWDYIVQTDTYYIKIRFEDDPKKIARNIQLAFASESLRGRTDVEYLDTRFGNKVYYKFKTLESEDRQ